MTASSALVLHLGQSWTFQLVEMDTEQFNPQMDTERHICNNAGSTEWWLVASMAFPGQGEPRPSLLMTAEHHARELRLLPSPPAADLPSLRLPALLATCRTAPHLPHVLVRSLRAQARCWCLPQPATVHHYHKLREGDRRHLMFQYMYMLLTS